MLQFWGGPSASVCVCVVTGEGSLPSASDASGTVAFLWDAGFKFSLALQRPLHTSTGSIRVVKGAEHELPVKGLWVWCGRVTFLEPSEYLEKPWEESNLLCRQLVGDSQHPAGRAGKLATRYLHVPVTTKACTLITNMLCGWTIPMPDSEQHRPGFVWCFRMCSIFHLH